MRFQQTGKGREHALVTIRNSESTLGIKAGAPVFLAMTGTGDGYFVVSAEGLSAPRYNFFYGFSIGYLNPGDAGESIVFGFCQSVRIALQTRAASTDSWPGYAAGSVGDFLDVETAAGAQAMYVNSPGLVTQNGVFAALGETFTLVASAVSATSDTRLLSTTLLKCFVRAL